MMIVEGLLLNRANTYSMEGNQRISSYNHIYANMTLTKITNPRLRVGTKEVRSLTAALYQNKRCTGVSDLEI
jgi:hypothetical protein